jgi:hypothetical protein
MSDNTEALPLDRAVDWHLDGTPITYRECIEQQCGKVALSYAERIQELALAHQAAPPAAQAEPAGPEDMAVYQAMATRYAAQAGDALPPKGSPLHSLGELLASVLDEDQWATAERMLLAARGAQAEQTGDEREAFEAWAAANQFDIHRDESDKYRDYHRATTRWAWQAWQARAALKGPPAQEVQTIHCPEKRKPGGCQLHNLHCGWPKCNEPKKDKA